MHLTRFIAPVVVATFLVGATGCSEDAQLDFEQDNADSFMAGCADTTQDLLIQAEICQCVIDTVQVRLRFTEFEAFETVLTAEVAEGDVPPPLPPEIVEIVAECVIEVGQL